MHCYNYQRHTPHRLSGSINNDHATIQNRKKSFVKLPGGPLSEIAGFLSYQEQVHLSSTCKSLLKETHGFSIDTITSNFNKNFENDVAKYLAPFKNEDNTFKPIKTILTGIKDKTITLPENKLIFKEVFNRVLSPLEDTSIKELIIGIKVHVTPEQLEELSSTAISKMSVEYLIKNLIVDIKDNISPKKLEDLASVAIEKMSDDHTIRVLLEGIKDNISPKKLEDLASVAIEKMSDDDEFRCLLVEIKDKISPNKLVELASIAIEKMSNGHNIRILLETINENLSTIQLENLRDQINPETPKACCTIM